MLVGIETLFGQLHGYYLRWCQTQQMSAEVPLWIPDVIAVSVILGAGGTVLDTHTSPVKLSLQPELIHVSSNFLFSPIARMKTSWSLCMKPVLFMVGAPLNV